MWKPTVAFFPLWSIFVCSPFGGLTKKPDNWRHVFFMWEWASVIHKENAIFYPQLLFMEGKCQKVSTPGCKVKLIKVTIWKEHALIFNQSALWENSKFACVVVEVNFLLWSGNVRRVCSTPHTKADGFLSWICLLLNYIGTLSREVFTLITILLKNAPVIRDSYKMEDGVENKFVS